MAVRAKGKDIVCSLVLGLALALVTGIAIPTYGARVSDFYTGNQSFALTAGITIAVFVISTSLCYALLRRGEALLAWADSKKPPKHLALNFDRKSIPIAAAVIFVCWIPWMVLQYPCSMNYDTYNQLYQFQTSSPTLYTTLGVSVPESYIDHHPVFDTLLFGAFLSLGDALGSQNIGLFAYSVFQCALTAIALGLACCYLAKLKVPWPFRFISLVFCSFFPPIPQWATCMLKDPINAALFVYFFLMAIEAVRSNGSFFASWKRTAGYIAVAMLVILTKKSGVLVVSITTLALLITYHQHWKQLVLGLIVPLVVCFAVIPATVYPAIGGVAPGGKQEAFGFALQQTITAINERDDLSEAERNAVSRVLDIEQAQKRYRSDVVDPVKNSTVRNASTLDYLSFIPAYFSIGLRHPQAYTASVFTVVGGLICPLKPFTYYNSPYDEENISTFANADSKGELHLTFDKPEPIESASDSVYRKIAKLYERIGPIAIFFSPGFYGGVIPIICLVICLFSDNKRSVLALVPIIVAVAIVVIGPAGSNRYVLPLLYSTPLMLGILCAALRSPSLNVSQGT